MAKLTDKQKRFADEYLVDLNATQAAKRAGYKDPNIGRQLITKNNVSEYIQKRRAKLEEKTQITQEKVLEELAAIGLAPSTDFAPDGVPIVLDAEHKTSSKLKALELLGKHLGMFDRRETGDVEDLSPLAELLKP